MTLAYVKPGVSISEIVSPSFSPLLIDPTSICLVGTAQGYAANTEVFVLNDNAAVQLSQLNIDTSSVVVRDASNVTTSPFVVNTDYTLDASLLATSGVLSILRTMQTTIADGEEVVAYFENSGSPAQGNSFSNRFTLNKLTSVSPADVTSGTVAASIIVQSEGEAPDSDYDLSGNGSATPTITWDNSASVLGKFQTVYVDYTIGDALTSDHPVQLNNLSAVSLPANATVTHVKNAPGADTTVQAVTFQKGSGTSLDYIVSGSGSSTMIARSAGTTSIGTTNDKLAVKVTYQATPSSYWLPTRCFSQSDVESKYGPSFDSAGNILNELSFAANMCFQNGANSVICQAVFQEGAPRTQTDGSSGDFTGTFVNLYDIEDINVVVPVLPVGANDSFADTVLGAAQNFVNYMALNQNQFVIAICGEDSTTGTAGSKATLQAHAEAFGSNTTVSDSFCLVSPASFSFPNPVTSAQSLMGGQFQAACVAGMLGRYPVQSPLTRKVVNGVVSVNDIRTESDKDEDAAAGLLVVEAKRGRIQIRHAITVSQVSRASQELNVVRAKHFMMENVRQALDTQVIGQIVLDDQATFRVQLLVTAVLQQMVSQGVLVSYENIQCVRDANDPTALNVQFSYLPAFPLNRIAVTFSLDSSQGVTFDTTSNTNVQGI